MQFCGHRNLGRLKTSKWIFLTSQAIENRSSERLMQSSCQWQVLRQGGCTSMYQQKGRPKAHAQHESCGFNSLTVSTPIYLNWKQNSSNTCLPSPSNLSHVMSSDPKFCTSSPWVLSSKHATFFQAEPANCDFGDGTLRWPHCNDCAALPLASQRSSTALGRCAKNIFRSATWRKGKSRDCCKVPKFTLKMCESDFCGCV